jgi:hypothetical protein
MVPTGQGLLRYLGIILGMYLREFRVDGLRVSKFCTRQLWRSHVSASARANTAMRSTMAGRYILLNGLPLPSFILSN